MGTPGGGGGRGPVDELQRLRSAGAGADAEGSQKDPGLFEAMSWFMVVSRRSVPDAMNDGGGGVPSAAYAAMVAEVGSLQGPLSPRVPTQRVMYTAVFPARFWGKSVRRTGRVLRVR